MKMLKSEVKEEVRIEVKKMRENIYEVREEVKENEKENKKRFDNLDVRIKNLEKDSLKRKRENEKIKELEIISDMTAATAAVGDSKDESEKEKCENYG